MDERAWLLDVGTGALCRSCVDAETVARLVLDANSHLTKQRPGVVRHTGSPRT